MIRLKNLLRITIAVLLFTACSEDTDPYTEYPVPSDWSIASSVKALPNSCTAIVALPDNIDQYSDDSDMVAAFMNNECRGLGNLVTSAENGKRVYYITIRASDTEDAAIEFRYYNSTLSYLYKATQTVDFEIDGTYGTYDSPMILELEYVN